jgi:ethylbenzene dioxygenase ferredoxin subunit
MADLIKLCKTADVQPGAMRQVDAEGLPSLAVYNLDGTFYVTANMCTHGMAWLTDGYLEGEEVECPFHGGRFSIKTGEPTAFPCVVPIEAYEVVVEGDDVCVKKPGG